MSATLRRLTRLSGQFDVTWSIEPASLRERDRWRTNGTLLNRRFLVRGGQKTLWRHQDGVSSLRACEGRHSGKDRMRSSEMGAKTLGGATSNQCGRTTVNTRATGGHSNPLQ